MERQPFKLGELVRTPTSLPAAWGRITRVYEEGRFYEVEKRYGRQFWRRKYGHATLVAAAEKHQRDIEAKRDRAKEARRLRTPRTRRA